MSPGRPNDDMKHATRHLRLLSLFTALTFLAPLRAQAAPAEDAQALAVFEAGYKYGQARYDGGEFLEAARTWIAAANNLSEKLSNRDNRVAVYEYVADAFTSGLQGVEQPAALREAATALEAYCDGFALAYGIETPISPKIIAARDDFKARLAKAEALAPAEGPVESPVVAEPPPVRDQPRTSKGWKGLVIAGGVLTGVGVGVGVLAAAYGAKGKTVETKYLDQGCRMMTSTDCLNLKSDGEASNTKAVGSTIVAVPLLAVGVALLVVGLKRRASSRTVFAPALAPGFAGLGLQRSF